MKDDLKILIMLLLLAIGSIHAPIYVATAVTIFSIWALVAINKDED